MPTAQLTFLASLILLTVTSSMVSAAPLQDDAPASSTSPAATPSAAERWNLRFRIDTGYTAQFKADLDDGGEYSVSRYGLAASVSFDIVPNLNLDIRFGYAHDAYDFSGNEGFAALEAWDGVDTWSVSPVLTLRLNEQWSLWGGPRFIHMVEDDHGDDEDTDGGVWTAGGSIGVTYRASDTLTLGGGVAVQSQLEDSISIFPIIILNWQFAPDWTLRTTGGGGTGFGGGAELAWTFCKGWEAAIGARYETRRFRLNQDDIAPDGIGQETILPVFARLSWTPCPTFTISLTAGAAMFGELRLEDEDGDRLADDEFSAAPFVSLSGTIRF